MIGEEELRAIEERAAANYRRTSTWTTAERMQARGDVDTLVAEVRRLSSLLTPALENARALHTALDRAHGVVR